ncbi:hypothetical protein MPR_2244 [Myroides profundi]|nr:hypothetical protein MPR_2244 [Myroides profundi]
MTYIRSNSFYIVGKEEKRKRGKDIGSLVYQYLPYQYLIPIDGKLH